MSNEWAAEQAKLIGKTVAALRGDRSGQWLSDRTNELGQRISRASISELENGKRKSVTLGEVCLLAAALDVAPIQLIYPGLPDGRVEALPGQIMTSWHATQWFSGESPPPLDAGNLLRKIRSRAEAQEHLRLTLHVLGIETTSDALAAEAVRLAGVIEDLNREIGDLGGVVGDQSEGDADGG